MIDEGEHLLQFSGWITKERRRMTIRNIKEPPEKEIQKKIRNIKKPPEKEIRKKKKDKGKVTGSSRPGDTSLRLFFGENENFAEILNKVVFRENIIRKDSLQDMDSVENGIIMVEGRKVPVHRERDLIKKSCGDTKMVLLAIENSGYVDYQIPLKVMGYNCINYIRQVTEISDRKKQRDRKKKQTASEYMSGIGKDDKITGIVNLVIYYGKEKWDAPLSLCEMMDLPEETRKYISDYKNIHFLDVMRLLPEEIDAFEGQVKILLGMLRYRWDTDAQEKFIRENGELLDTVTEVTMNAVKVLCDIDLSEIYRTVLGIRDEQEIQNEIENHKKNGGIRMNEAFLQIFERAKLKADKEGYDRGSEEGYGRGSAEGYNRGSTEGYNRSKNETIIKMHQLGMKPEVISECTSIPVKKVESIILKHCGQKC